MNNYTFPYPKDAVLYVIDAGVGAWGCNGRTVKVIDYAPDDWNGITSSNGFFVKEIDNERIWKVTKPGTGAEYSFVKSQFEVELL